MTALSVSELKNTKKLREKNVTPRFEKVLHNAYSSLILEYSLRIYNYVLIF